ncbi:Arc family DNA-binding protein [Pseudomonas sp. UBA7530]|uniref:Arc family DNA-binding protein n=1 Tax=Pseudomonas sp. UBA7530 TaxID=1947341 RepID=UPI0025CBBEA0|nr:Arc family DNA-binding protein [Pseudomonas sp. UBA7530]
MSREDPQFKLRMPQELRAQAEQAAKSSGRSLNAELVARIQSSFVADSSSIGLLPAKRAKELALMARAAIPEQIKKRAIEAISRAIKMGHSEALVGLEDFQLDVGMSDEEFENLISKATGELKDAGYKVEVEDVTALSITF